MKHFTALCYVSTVLTVVMSVCLSIHHMPVLYQNS